MSLGASNNKVGSVALIFSILTAPAALAVDCTTTSNTANNFTYIYFKSISAGCNWTVPASVTKIDLLVVAGGGGGGTGDSTANEAGGGGAGGMIENLGISVTPNSQNNFISLHALHSFFPSIAYGFCFLNANFIMVTIYGSITQRYKKIWWFQMFGVILYCHLRR